MCIGFVNVTNSSVAINWKINFVEQTMVLFFNAMRNISFSVDHLSFGLKTELDTFFYCTRTFSSYLKYRTVPYNYCFMEQRYFFVVIKFVLEWRAYFTKLKCNELNHFCGLWAGIFSHISLIWNLHKYRYDTMYGKKGCEGCWPK